MGIEVYELYGNTGAAKAVGERTYKRHYVVFVDDDSLPVTETDISLASGAPRRFDSLGPQDAGALLTDLSIDEDKGCANILWMTATYTTYHGDQEEQHPNPLLRPVEWDYETVKTTRTDARDRRGNAYETTAGEPFASPPEFTYAVSRWTATVNVPTFSDGMAETFAYAVNSVAFKGKAPGTVLCDGITASDEQENGFDFWRMTVVFLIDTRNPWQPLEVANKGYRYLDDDGNEQTSKTLVWLNAAGKKWTDTDAENEKYIERYPLNEADFRVIPV